MKILHIITGLNNGGAEGALYRLVSSDIQRGNKHIVVSLMDGGAYAAPLQRAGATVYLLDMPRGKITVSGLCRLYRLIKDVKPNVVQTWMYHADLIGGVISRMAGVRAIAWNIRHANLGSAQNKRTSLWAVKICAILSGLVPARIISCSSKAVVVHQALGYQKEKFTEIPNGYTFDLLMPDNSAREALRDKLKILPNVFVVGMVARFDAQKDHLNLLSSLALLRDRNFGDFVCLLVGKGMDHQNTILKTWITEMGLEHCIKLLGERCDIPAIMSALDIHILSSIGESFPNVIAEAMACGTPCVTTDVGDAGVIVDQFGWVVPAQNPEALFNAIADARHKHSIRVEWKALQEACRSHINDNFSIGKMVDAYRKTWQECIDISIR